MSDHRTLPLNGLTPAACLKQLLREHGLTAHTLAPRLHVSRDILYNILREASPVPAHVAWRLERYFDRYSASEWLHAQAIVKAQTALTPELRRELSRIESHAELVLKELECHKIEQNVTVP